VNVPHVRLVIVEQAKQAKLGHERCVQFLGPLARKTARQVRVTGVEMPPMPIE